MSYVKRELEKRQEDMAVKVNQWLFLNYELASDILKELRVVAEKSKGATVSDLYNMISEQSPLYADIFGWTKEELENIEIVEMSRKILGIVPKTFEFEPEIRVFQINFPPLTVL